MDRIFSSMTISELTRAIQSSIAEVLIDAGKYKQAPPQDRKINGIKELAEFLQCSEPTAVKIGKSGKFKRYQKGRKVFFYESEVLSGLSE